MRKIIAVLPGDGIGPEVMTSAVKVLECIAQKFDHHFDLQEGLIGGAAFEKYQNHFPEQTQSLCEKADAILFGSVGGPINEAHLPKWENCEKNSILALRKTFQLSANFRPVYVYPSLRETCPLKNSVVKNGVDLVIVRELVGDIYFGEHKQWIHENKRYASDVAEYNEMQIAAVAHHAFKLAQQRTNRITSVDKANVLDTSKLWRKIVSEISTQYPDVTLEHMLVDNCAMQLVINPSQFDVILTGNLFGDILSDLAAALPGSLGLIPSASVNEKQFGLYEPSGGSAPSIAGKNSANPIAQILSAALMLRYSFGLENEATCIENAVRQTLDEGWRTQDIGLQGEKLIGTKEMTEKILSALVKS